MRPIDCRDKDKRLQLIEFLEAKGYNVVIDYITNKDILIESKFPIIVDSENRTIDMYHTITSAAAAASSGMLLSIEDFYKEFKE